MDKVNEDLIQEYIKESLLLAELQPNMLSNNDMIYFSFVCG